MNVLDPFKEVLGVRFLSPNPPAFINSLIFDPLFDRVSKSVYFDSNLILFAYLISNSLMLMTPTVFNRYAKVLKNFLLVNFILHVTSLSD